MKPVFYKIISCILYQQMESVCVSTGPDTLFLMVLNCLRAVPVGVARIPCTFLTAHQLCQRKNFAFKRVCPLYAGGKK